MIKDSLHPLPQDDRDFTLGAVYSLPPVEALPESFLVGASLEVKDQGSKDYCTAYASCTVSELQEGVILLPVWNFAKTKEIMGNPEEWGADLRSACKSHQKYGAVEKSLVDNGIVKIPDNPRDIKNWNNYEMYGELHKKISYLKVDGPYDPYDNIRASLFKFQDENRGVVAGLEWKWSRKDKILKPKTGTGSGHAIAILGWNKDGLIMQNSYGTKTGNNGAQIITREVINENIPKYGAFMFFDQSPEDIKYAIDNSICLDVNLLIQMIQSVLNVLNDVLNKLKSYVR